MVPRVAISVLCGQPLVPTGPVPHLAALLACMRVCAVLWAGAGAEAGAGAMAGAGAGAGAKAGVGAGAKAGAGEIHDSKFVSRPLPRGPRDLFGS